MDDHGRSAASAVVTLSPREHEVYLLVRQGKSNKEIARACGISTLTVKNHLQRLLKKTGMRNRTQVAGASLVIEVASRAPTAVHANRGKTAGAAEYDSWSRSLPDNLTLTVKPLSPGEEEYISWYWIGIYNRGMEEGNEQDASVYLPS